MSYYFLIQNIIQIQVIIIRSQVTNTDSLITSVYFCRFQEAYEFRAKTRK